MWIIIDIENSIDRGTVMLCIKAICIFLTHLLFIVWFICDTFRTTYCSGEIICTEYIFFLYTELF